MRVLIVPDKFKGTLPASAAAAAISAGWSRARPQDSLSLIPMSDGGDGFGEVIGGLMGAKRRSLKTVDPAHHPVTAHWWWSAQRRTAIIETAAAVGLALLPKGKYHPFALDTFGLGALLRKASSLGATRCIVGIGGSATNDGGFGLARSTGWIFRDPGDAEIEHWIELDRLADVQPPKRRRWFKELIVATDVRNPLLGARGATRIYGPQKGLLPADLPVAESRLRRLASVLRKQLALNTARSPGAGAAGGLGFAFATFYGGRLVPGFNLFSQLAKLDDQISKADLVITGEGRVDRSTLMGKGVGQIARKCRATGVPCICLAGDADPNLRHDCTGRGECPPEPASHRCFSQLHALTDEVTSEVALKHPAHWLARLAERTARAFQFPCRT